MRLLPIIVFLSAIAVGVVHIRRAEITSRHEIQRLQSRRVEVRRLLWDQQVQLSKRMAPAEIRRRADEMCLELVEADAGQGRPAGRRPPGRNWRR